MKTTFNYDLIDDNGISTIELPIKLYPGTIFEHEFGTYEVIKKPEEAPDEYDSIPCERIAKPKPVTNPQNPAIRPVSDISQEDLDYWYYFHF